MRASRFIDFDTGNVTQSPMDLATAFKRPWTDDNKIDWFEAQVDVWMLGVAAALLRQIETHQKPSIWSHSAYAILSICLPYFEMVGKMLHQGSKASGTSGVDFYVGFCDVYPGFKPANHIYANKLPAATGQPTDNPDIQPVKEFYDRTRCGLFHVGYTKHGVWLHSDAATPDFEIRAEPHPDHPGQTRQAYRVNAHRITRTLINHFPTVMARIKTDPATKTKFLQYFNDFLA